MDYFKNILSYLSAFGFILSLSSHLCARFGIQGPLGEFTFALHFGILVVWIPAIIISRKIKANVPSKDLLDTILEGSPKWLRYGLHFFFYYAILNFFLFMIQAPSSNHVPDTQPQSTAVWGYSGHWMVFYAVAFTIFTSKARTGKPGRFCPNGHPVVAAAQSCETCGSPVNPSVE